MWPDMHLPGHYPFPVASLIVLAAWAVALAVLSTRRPGSDVVRRLKLWSLPMSGAFAIYLLPAVSGWIYFDPSGFAEPWRYLSYLAGFPVVLALGLMPGTVVVALAGAVLFGLALFRRRPFGAGFATGWFWVLVAILTASTLWGGFVFGVLS